MKISYLVLVNNEELFQGLRLNLKTNDVDDHYIIPLRSAQSITRGYNDAARAAPLETEVFCFIHQDARLHFNVQAVLPLFFGPPEHRNAGVLGFVGSDKITLGGAWWLDGKRYGKLIQGDKFESFEQTTVPVDVVDGYCMFIRKDVFNQIGGFDEQFDNWHFYDSDICMAAKSCGFQNYVLNEMTQHLSQGSMADPWTSEQQKFTKKWSSFIKKL